MIFFEYKFYDYLKCLKINFKGCIEDLIFCDKNVIREVECGFNFGYYLFGKVLFKCKEFDYCVVIMISFNEGFKVIVKKLLIDNDIFFVSFWFCIFVGDGFFLLCSVIKVKLYICLLSGFLCYDVIVLNGFKIELVMGFNFDDGEWYSVNVSI